MEEERLTILRMVAENKISAEDAAKLLDAMRAGETVAATGSSDATHSSDESYNQQGHKKDRSREARRQERDHARNARQNERQERRRARHRQRDQRRTNHHSSWQNKIEDFTKVFDDVFGSEGVFGSHGMFGKDFPFGSKSKNSEQSLTLPEDSEVHIHSAAGNLTIKGTDQDEMRIKVQNAQGLPSIISPRVSQNAETKRVDINSTTQDILVEVPWHMTSLYTTVAGGHLHISDVSTNFYAVQDGGPLVARDITGIIHAQGTGGPMTFTNISTSDLNIQSTGGPAEISLEDIQHGTIQVKSVGGPIAVKLPASSAFDLEAHAAHSHIITNMDTDQATMSKEEDGSHSFQTIHNGGGAKISLLSEAGGIECMLIDEEATVRLEDEP